MERQLNYPRKRATRIRQPKKIAAGEYMENGYNILKEDMNETVGMKSVCRWMLREPTPSGWCVIEDCPSLAAAAKSARGRPTATRAW